MSTKLMINISSIFLLARLIYTFQSPLLLSSGIILIYRSVLLRITSRLRSETCTTTWCRGSSASCWTSLIFTHSTSYDTLVLFLNNMIISLSCTTQSRLFPQVTFFYSFNSLHSMGWINHSFWIIDEPLYFVILTF